ncbi:MAG: hypothetical protein RBR68_11395 [Tenuifilaceae bacterium]|jgi:hypothetical protein|nr:hypothetical protein [Tenuifilaceae bacterium]
MSKKIFVIEGCYDCPLSKVTKLYESTLICKHPTIKNRLIEDIDYFSEIPDWCPLEDYKESINENI